MGSRDRSSRIPSERSVPDRFESFDLSIERIDESYRAQVTESPVGPRPPVAIDPAHLEAGEPSPGDRSEPTRDVRRRPVDRADLRRLGERLFRAVFADAIGEAFRASVERARNEDTGLRIRLQLDRAPELATLPWEALWDPTVRAFLADQHDLPVVRALGVAAEAPVITPLEPPLRLLALLPEPRGEDKLGGAGEWQQIQAQLAPLIEEGMVEAERLDPPSLDALGKRIDLGPCHVLHVVAHGGPGDRGAGGLLKLEDASGGLDQVTGVDLARALERRKAPRLVVLNACHGARAAVDDAFDGMAQHLLSRGVPAVVAMRTAISDAAAVSFAVTLYRELAMGRTVEAAMVEARRVLSLGEHRAEWATPVLYLRGDNVRIFDDASGERSVPPVRDAGQRIRRFAGPILAALVAALSAVFLWWNRTDLFPPTGSGRCPPPPGVQDLQFVEVDPGVVDLGDRKVTVEEAFCIATKEVSRRDWQAVMGGELPRSDWPLDWPMTDVTPDDSVSFVEKLEGRDPGVVYRLPTAAEWEYAARAGEKTDYFFGDDPSELHRFGNCRNFLRSDRHDGPAPIGSYQPNTWGLYDVHGNVAEWVQPRQPTEPLVDDAGQALRLGGSFDNAARNCTFEGSRSEVKADVNRGDTGLRVARELNVEEDED